MKKNRNNVAGFRPTPEVERQLNELATHWGENRSRTIIRAIAIAHQVAFPPKIAEALRRKGES